MAGADQAGMLRRLRAALPRDWYPESAPVLDAALAAPAWMLSWAHALLTWARAQTRLRTAGGTWLDAAARDYLGGRVRRRGQSDGAFRRRVQAELLRERGTRAGLSALVGDLTGREVDVFEPARVRDTGGYGIAATMGYGAAGRWGSLRHPFQAFVTARRPLGVGVPYASGYGAPAAGYRLGGTQWAGATAAADAVTDEDIAEAVAGAVPAGAIAWLRVTP